MISRVFCNLLKARRSNFWPQSRAVPATVRPGLAQLDWQGLIHINARWTAKVSVDPAAQIRETVQYFRTRLAGIHELRENGPLFWDPILKCGLRRWDDDDWALLFRRLAISLPWPLSTPVEFHLAALDRLDNELILNLFWEQIQ